MTDASRGGAAGAAPAPSRHEHDVTGDQRSRRGSTAASSTGGRPSPSSAPARSAARPRACGRAREALADRPAALRFRDLEVSVPTLTVLAHRRLRPLPRAQRAARARPLGRRDDQRIARRLPARRAARRELVGDLRALVREVHTPLAVRSSSLLEDALAHPFAGVYATKMIPNNQPDPDDPLPQAGRGDQVRLRLDLLPRGARLHARRPASRRSEEKMAVIVQEVVGAPARRPLLPGHRPAWPARATSTRPGTRGPPDGVVNLALGLGKTIVDGGLSWTYSPAYPRGAAAVQLARATCSSRPRPSSGR